MSAVILLFVSTLIQNASFTLISRARNGNNLGYHAIASVISGFVWLFVIKQIVVSLDKPIMWATYIVAGTVGSLAMHWIAIHKLERTNGR